RYLPHFHLPMPPPPPSTLFPYTTLFRSVPKLPCFGAAAFGSLLRRRLIGEQAVGAGHAGGRAGREVLENVLLRLSAGDRPVRREDRKSTRLNSSHVAISYAVFCLKKKIR